MKLKLLLALTAVALSGCQSTQETNLTPSADETTIAEARKALAQYENFSVSDDGVISLVETLPNRYVWRTSVIKKQGRQLSCDNLRYFVEKGMVVSIHFKGPKGRFDHYDENRCLAEDKYLEQ